MADFKIMAINRHRLNIDGNGICTLVGLMDCNLSCKYCLNKKSLGKKECRYLSPKELLNKVMIDYCYFVATNGGVTFGGGEPLLQYKQIIEFAKELLNVGLDDVEITVETALNVDSKVIEEVYNYINHFIIDIKDINSLIYESYTGSNNSKVLKNLMLLRDLYYTDKCTIRIPRIAEYNNESNIQDSLIFIQELGFKDVDIFNYVVR